MAERKQPKFLIISDKDNISLSVSKLLKETYGDDSVDIVKSPLAGRNEAREHKHDVIILNAPIENDLGDELAGTIAKLTYASVIMLIPEQIADRVNARVTDLGIFVLDKPLRKEDFLHGTEAAVLSAHRTKVLYEENQDLKRRIKDLQVVDQAKVLLVEYLKLSESQAHKYITQQAMELRKTKGEVARSIIKTYQT